MLGETILTRLENKEGDVVRPNLAIVLLRPEIFHVVGLTHPVNHLGAKKLFQLVALFFYHKELRNFAECIALGWNGCQV
jgi:hypothetical protein